MIRRLQFEDITYTPCFNHICRTYALTPHHAWLLSHHPAPLIWAVGHRHLMLLAQARDSRPILQIQCRLPTLAPLLGLTQSTVARLQSFLEEAKYLVERGKKSALLHAQWAVLMVLVVKRPYLAMRISSCLDRKSEAQRQILEQVCTVFQYRVKIADKTQIATLNARGSQQILVFDCGELVLVCEETTQQVFNHRLSSYYESSQQSKTVEVEDQTWGLNPEDDYEQIVKDNQIDSSFEKSIGEFKQMASHPEFTFKALPSPNFPLEERVEDHLECAGGKVALPQAVGNDRCLEPRRGGLRRELGKLSFVYDLRREAGFIIRNRR